MMEEKVIFTTFINIFAAYKNGRSDFYLSQIPELLVELLNQKKENMVRENGR
jgi:hypothetical protein